MNEDSLLQRIGSRSSDFTLRFPRVLLGPGDDAAAVRPDAGSPLLIGVDQLVQGRHFDDGTDTDAVARKAVARSVSDLAAMGATPRWALATGALPDGFTDADILFDAMARWAERWDAPLIGGDLSSTDGPLVLSVTVAGSMDRGVNPVRRSGATPGDELWITGPVGDSYASGWHLAFEPRLDCGRSAARGGARAMIDLSDGLGKDAARVGMASGVRLRIEAGAIPLRAPSRGWAQSVRDGEDHELLASAPPGSELGAGWIGPIGSVREGEPGAEIVDEDGVAHDAGAMGWTHGGPGAT